MRKFLLLLPKLWVNWITLAGTVITTVTGCTLVMAFAADALNPFTNQYTSALMFLVAPFIFIIGLVLIPIGLFYEKRKRGHLDDPVFDAFRTAVADKRGRSRILFFIMATLINIAVLGAVGNRALTFMNTSEFCGTMCHSVMESEYNSYIASPHSRVPCVSCHIGSGASWAAKAKVDGLRQVWAVMTDSFSRPIPAPVEKLRPARDTCEQCHWPSKFHGNRIVFYPHFEEDEKNSMNITALALKVGGVNTKTGEYQGIHWHVSPDIEVAYESLNDKREKIGTVTWKENGKVVREYTIEGQESEVVESRVMDCVDCHNRPTHVYDNTPQVAVDRAMLEGRLDQRVPFLRKVAVQVMTPSDLPWERLSDHFFDEMKKVYEKDHADKVPDDKRLRYFASVLGDVYKHNVHVEMGIGWETYPNHLGHRGDDKDKRGCFRCHDDEHKDKEGNVISQDCDVCHEILHMDEALSDLPDSLKSLFPTQ